MARGFHRGFSRPLRQGQRRATEWLGSADVSVTQNLAANTVILLQSLTAVEIAKLPFTVTRTRGSIWVASDQVAATRTPFGALGFSVVSQPAIAIGVTAVPLPLFDENSDMFFVHTFWATSFTFVTAAGFSSDGFIRTDFDSKAMRKVQEGEDIAVVVENGAAAGGVDMLLKFRLLIKLH